MNYAVIMAGGAGTRFWPLSTEEKPKQFLDILGTGKTFLQLTVDRLDGALPFKNIYIVTNEKYKNIIKTQLPRIQDYQIICEPTRNNTAPCILLAALKIQKADPDACCLFIPSDQLIIDTGTFKSNVLTALHFAANHPSIVTIGIIPSRPETGYGYIKFDETEAGTIKPVYQFVEKPNLDTANLYLASGKYLWNAGMFAWHVKTIEQEFKSYAASIYEILAKGLPYYNTKDEAAFLASHYPTTENISVDFAIMEKSSCVYTLPAKFDWSDLGIWSSIFEVASKDDANNATIEGGAILEDSNNNLVILPKGKKAILRGLDDMIIVDSGKALLIYPKNQEQHIKSSQAKIVSVPNRPNNIVPD